MQSMVALGLIKPGLISPLHLSDNCSLICSGYNLYPLIIHQVYAVKVLKVKELRKLSTMKE